MELLIHSAAGIYTPQWFAERYSDNIVNKDELKEDLETLKNTEDEWYWEAWDKILSEAKLKFPFSNKLELRDKVFTLSQNDGDLWVIAEGEEIPEDWQNC